MTTLLQVTLNAPLRPNDRGRIYEDPLQRVIDERHPGSQVAGGGTMLSTTGEVAWCDIDIELADDPETGAAVVIDFLEWIGAPKGSTARLGDGDGRTFGRTEGVAVYLNGYDLPQHIYAESDVNELIRGLKEQLGRIGRMHSFWEGPRETALYFYGKSAADIRSTIRPVLDTYPLATRCRVVDLPHSLPDASRDAEDGG